jgi:hypothetical protein
MRGMRAAVASIAAAVMFVAPLASGQSDTERAAARQLFAEGMELQQGGKYADALDKFQHVQRILNAPTTQLHIGQCQAALGKLLEAAEAYRAATRIPVPAGNALFAQAEEDAKRELAKVEPRIPKVTVTVTPASAPGLAMQIDGQPINSALIGEQIPLDPGAHTITVTATGYASNEQTVSLGENDSKSMSVSLVPAASSPPGPAPPATPTADVPPPPAAPAMEQPPSAATSADRSFLLGARLGAEFPLGDLDGTGNDHVGDIAGTGVGLGADLGIRLKKFYLGITYEFSTYTDGGLGGNLASKATSDTSITTSTRAHYIGADFAFITNPQGIGAWLEVGAGYRIFSPTQRLSSISDATQFVELDETYTGFDGRLGAGLYLALGPWLRLVPKATFAAGSYSNFSQTCSSGPPPNTCNPGDTASGSINQTGTHMFVFAGVEAYYDVGLH